MDTGSSRFAAPEAGARAPVAAARPGGAVPLTGGGRLPLVFLIAGQLAFGLAAAWLARATTAGVPPYLHPEMVAVAHLWLPGFLLSVCLGAGYQLMPVVLGEALRVRDGWLWTHAVLHTAGVAALVCGLAGGRYVFAGLGGAAVAAGTLIAALATLRTFLASRRRDAAAWSFLFAAGWLLATTLAGVALAINRRQGFLPLPAIHLLHAHAHLGLAGYFATLLQGVTFQLVPMFTMGEARRPCLAMAALLATQAGLPVLAAGLAWNERALILTGAGVLAAGIAGSGVALAATLATRRRRRLDVGVRAFVIGLAVLGLAALAGLGLAGKAAGEAPAWNGIAAYGLLVIAGGLSLAVLGMLAKILPFLVWMRAYGPRVGKAPVPIATALASRKLEKLWLWLHGAGLVCLVTGAASGARWPATAGGWLLAAGAAAWLGNSARVLRHLLARA
ncbi:MAG: hypothetical protein MUE42_01180 [Opitutaceae bacterium]|jgi:hypothetical protein|nr:hypothetical protein [Opitutaceae bacterium]